jgi:Tol biopolymer transport system component
VPTYSRTTNISPLSLVAALLGFAACSSPGTGVKPSGGSAGSAGNGGASGVTGSGGNAGSPSNSDGGGDDGGGVTATQMIGPTGGTITLNGATVTIPAGAVTTATAITITDTGRAPPSTYRAYSNIFEFSPDGIQFAKPITISLPFKGDSTLATLFWSKPTSTGTAGYDWVGGTVTGTALGARVTHFSQGFIADGINYSDPPDISCVSSKLIEGRIVAPAGVAAFFSVDDCWGRPITGLAASQFNVTEDGSAISIEASETVIPKPGLQVFVMLMLDLSTSSAVQLPQLVAGAKAFVSQLNTSNLPVEVGIDVFTSSIVQWQAPTLDTTPGGVLQKRLDALLTYTPADPNSTNLNGAVIRGLADLDSAEKGFESRNYGGALTSGYLLLFTAGRDTSAINTVAEVQAAEAASPDGVLAITLQGGDYDPAAIAKIAPNDAIAANTPVNLTNAFAGLAQRMAGEFERVYLLGYCSPSRAGSHAVSVQVVGAMNKTATHYAFSATTFGGGCKASLFEPATACAAATCGGLACGACDERTSFCDGPNGLGKAPNTCMTGAFGSAYLAFLSNYSQGTYAATLNVAWADGSGTPAQLATGVAFPPVLSPDGRHITFISNYNASARTGTLGLINNIESSRASVQLAATSYGTDWGFLQFSPDSNHVAFVAINNNLCTSEVSNADGSGTPVQLGTPVKVGTAGGCVRFLFSPDSNHIAFITDYNAASNSGTLEVTSADGSGTPIQLGTGVYPSFYYLSFSSDGKRLSFVANGILTVANVDGSGTPVQLGTGPVAPVFSPDGKHIAFVTNPVRVPNTDSMAGTLAVVGGDGSGVPIQLGTGVLIRGTSRDSIAFSPDSKHLSFLDNVGTIGNDPNNRVAIGTLEIANADGSGTPMQLGTKLSEYFLPQFSPDGSHIAFSSGFTEAGPGALEVARTDGVGSPVILAAGRSYGVLFSPDGAHLIFASDAQTGRIEIVNGDGSGTPVLFGFGSPGQFSPDSKHVTFTGANNTLMVANADGSGTPAPLGVVAYGTGFALFSPDSSHLAFQAIAGGTVPPGTYPVENLEIVNADGSGTPVQLGKLGTGTGSFVFF